MQYPLWVPNLFGSPFYIFLLRQYFSRGAGEVVDLMTPLIYLRNEALFTAPLGIKFLLDRFNAQGGGEGDYQVIMAGTLLLVVPMILLFAVFQKYFICGIAVQGRKG